MGDPKTITAREFITQLLAEVDETDPEMLPPPTPKQKGDKVLALITDDFLKKLMCLSNFYRREGGRLKVDLEASGENVKKNPTFSQHRQKHDTLMEMFWYGLRSQIGIWDQGIGIRKGWEVVNCDDEEDNALPAALRKLFGQE